MKQAIDFPKNEEEFREWLKTSDTLYGSTYRLKIAVRERLTELDELLTFSKFLGYLSEKIQK